MNYNVIYLHKSIFNEVNKNTNALALSHFRLRFIYFVHRFYKIVVIVTWTMSMVKTLKYTHADTFLRTHTILIKNECWMVCKRHIPQSSLFTTIKAIKTKTVQRRNKVEIKTEICTSTYWRDTTTYMVRYCVAVDTPTKESMLENWHRGKSNRNNE